MKRHAVWVLSLAVAGCTSTGDPAPPRPGGPPTGCTPDRAAFEATVLAVIAERCGTCHGEEPRFGAPLPLLDYDALIEGADGDRTVDLMVTRVAEGSMPPVGAPRPTVAERDAIARWASCGSVGVDEPVGLDANRPPFVAPEDPPEGLDTIDLTADRFAVGPDVRDLYANLDFTNLVDEDVFIRRFDAIVDDARVLHHLTLRRGEEGETSGMKYLYAWAPGTGAFQLRDGGVRLAPGDLLRVQIHYNNGVGAADVRDSSGVRLWVGPAEGREYVMVDPGPGAIGFSIPPRMEGTVESTCQVRQPVTAVATMPHMHEIGRDFEIHRERGGAEATLLRLDAWSFDTQLFYDFPVDLAVGDRLTVRCTYENPFDEAVRAGPGTGDEMCYAFTYVTPPTPDFCSLGGPTTGELEYVPGACIAEPIPELPPIATEIGEAPTFDADGALPDGHFVFDHVIMETDSPGVLALAEIEAVGQVVVRDGVVEIDGAFHITAPTAELREGRQIDFSFRGTPDAPSGPTRLTATCPPGAGVPFDIGTVGGTIVLRNVFGGLPISVTAWMFAGETR